MAKFSGERLDWPSFRLLYSSKLNNIGVVNYLHMKNGHDVAESELIRGVETNMLNLVIPLPDFKDKVIRFQLVASILQTSGRYWSTSSRRVHLCTNGT